MKVFRNILVGLLLQFYVLSGFTAWAVVYEPLPDMPYPADNPPTPKKEKLGSVLFFDPRLSGSNLMSCSSCHFKNLLDIDYIYAEQELVESQQTKTEDLGFSSFKLPAELLNSLKDAAGLYSITSLEKLLADLEQAGENCKPLAVHLRTLADQYDMEGVLEVLAKIKDNSTA
jgi:hypothetical protein